MDESLCLTAPIVLFLIFSHTKHMIFYSKRYYCAKTEDYKIPCDLFDDIYTCGYHVLYM